MSRTTPQLCCLSLALAILAVTSCGSEPRASLVVNLRTDLVANEEFDGVHVTLIPLSETGPSLHYEVNDVEEGYLPAARLVAFSDVPAGDYELQTAPVLAGTASLASPQRTFVAFKEQSLALTVLVPRSCLTVVCGEGETCFDGACVDSRCSAETPEFCGEPSCEQDSECFQDFGCATGECSDGTCWAKPKLGDEEGACNLSSEWCVPAVGCTPQGETADLVSEVDPVIYLEDDFEGDLLDHASGSELSSGAELLISSSQVHSGDAALYASLPEGGTKGEAALYHAFEEPLVEGSVYVRVWVYLPSTTAPNNTILLLQLDDNDREDGGTQDKVSVDLFGFRRLQLALNSAESNGADDGEFLNSDFDVVPRDEWMCLELLTQLDRESGSASVYLNGDLLLDARGGVGTVPRDGLSRIYYGIPDERIESRANKSEVFVDDVVIANYRVGCTK